MATLSVDIVTAERLVYAGEADLVLAPGSEGQLGILPSHAPLLAELEPGELMIRSGEREEDMALTGGFIEVFANRVTVLANAAEQVGDIDRERAERALARAQERIAARGPDVDLARAAGALQRSRARLRVAAREQTRAVSETRRPPTIG